jgi:GNAT superfamily N-acetyltransferase
VSFVVRRAVATDVRRMIELVRELAEYEREPDSAKATEEDFLRDGFGANPAFEAFVAESNEGGTVDTFGLALYFYVYSTWTGRKSLHVEDLFVRPAYRGRGAGLALMRALAREAVDRGCARFVWQVLDWNAPAIAFYEGLGAKVLKDWIAVRLDGDALAALGRRPNE